MADSSPRGIQFFAKSQPTIKAVPMLIARTPACCSLGESLEWKALRAARTIKAKASVVENPKEIPAPTPRSAVMR